MLTGLKNFTEEELRSRRDIQLENYCKTVVIEAETMLYMVKTQIVPAIEKYAADLAGNAAAKQALSSGIACGYEIKTVTRLSALTDDIMDKALELEHALTDLGSSEDIVTESALVRDTILPKMCELRLPCDEAETMTAKSCWPYPTYSDLLFGV